MPDCPRANRRRRGRDWHFVGVFHRRSSHCARQSVEGGFAEHPGSDDCFSSPVGEPSAASRPGGVEGRPIALCPAGDDSKPASASSLPLGRIYHRWRRYLRWLSLLVVFASIAAQRSRAEVSELRISRGYGILYLPL